MKKIFIATLLASLTVISHATNWEVLDSAKKGNMTISVDTDSIVKQKVGHDQIPFVSALGKLSYKTPQNTNGLEYSHIVSLISFNCASKKKVALKNTILDTDWNVKFEEKLVSTPSLLVSTPVKVNTHIETLYNWTCFTQLDKDLIEFDAKPVKDNKSIQTILDEYPLQFEQMGL